MEVMEWREVMVTYCNFCGKEIHGNCSVTICAITGIRRHFHDQYIEDGENCLDVWRNMQEGRDRLKRDEK
uniref:Uncharacterized protein n=1 Tax=viral metagenome TaxID=1070528 RepID=A0A6M3X6I5_9ZZZZ